MKTDKPETGSAVVASSTLFFFLTRVRCLVSRHEEYVCARACCAPGIYWTNEADTAYHTLFAYRWQLYAPPFCATRLTYHILCAGEWRCLEMVFRIQCTRPVWVVPVLVSVKATYGSSAHIYQLSHRIGSIASFLVNKVEYWSIAGWPWAFSKYVRMCEWHSFSLYHMICARKYCTIWIRLDFIGGSESVLEQ